MPIINVAVTGKPDPALSARIAGEITQLTATHLRKDPTVTAVAIAYHDPQHWFAGGKSLAEHGANTFWLDIKVVDGTNTKLELEAYLQAIFAAFGRILGTVHEESYVFVHEVPAAAYGYGGRTQEFRFISGRVRGQFERQAKATRVRCQPAPHATALTWPALALRFRPSGRDDPRVVTTGGAA